jgi:hypothetical protein
MFGFAEWDSWLSFILEGALSLAVLVGLIFIARRVNASAEADRRRRLESHNDVTADDGRPAADDRRSTIDEGVKRET